MSEKMPREIYVCDMDARIKSSPPLPNDTFFRQVYHHDDKYRALEAENEYLKSRIDAAMRHLRIVAGPDACNLSTVYHILNTTKTTEGK